MKRLLHRVLALLAVVLALSAQAQSPAKSARIGYLTPSGNAHREAVFRDELAKLGWVEGRNLVIEYRSANGSFERLPALADELVRLDVDLIVAVVTQASVATKAATTTIPIVMVGVGDPLGAGLVSSLARPSGNVTGNSGAFVEVIGKQLELLRELQPGVSRVAVLWNPSNPVFQAQLLEQAKVAAAALGVDLSVVEARRPEALHDAFKAIDGQRPEALLILGDPTFSQHAERIARLALTRRLPTVTGSEIFADAGALLVYGPAFDEFWRRAAIYVDRILKGARPAELPVERPVRFELIVNARTAKALGVTIPASLAARADRVVD